MKKLRGIFLVALLTYISVSCYRDNRDDLYKNYDKSGFLLCDSTATKFNKDIYPIFLDNCAVSGCHVGTSPQSGLDLSRYNDIKNIALTGLLEKRITASPEQRMPKGGTLSDCEINRIITWVNEGALNN